MGTQYKRQDRRLELDNNKFKFQINSATSFDFDMFYYVAGVFALFFCVDVYYFLRGLVIFVIALIRPKRQVSSTFNVYSVCWPNHIDPFLHMNNSRYLREMDFGRYDFYIRTGLRRQFSDTVLNACLIRYRRAISVCTLFKVETKVVWVENRSLYLQQRIISLLDGFVRSDALLKMTTSNSDLIRILRDEYEYERPEICPTFVKCFTTADKMGSKELREELEDGKSR